VHVIHKFLQAIPEIARPRAPLDCGFLGEPRIIFFSNNRTTPRRLTQFTNTRREDVAPNITKNGFAEVSKNLARYKFEINFLIKIIM